MCIGLWSLQHPDYALILVSNRDEYLNRPTAPAHFHDFGPLDDIPSDGRVLSGRDLRAGGTWLGVSRSGRVALLTNITEPAARFAASRGHLVSSFLRGDATLDDEVFRLTSTTAIDSGISPESAKYAGFNLLLLAPSRNATPDGTIQYNAALLTNHGAGGKVIARKLSEKECRCGALSNGIDGQGADSWPKVQIGASSLHSLLEETPASKNADCPDPTERLFEIMRWCPDTQPRTRAELRNAIHITPVPVAPNDMDKESAPEFYGTRLSTVVLISRSGEVTFVERDIWMLNAKGTYEPAPSEQQRAFQFRIQQ